MVNEEVVSIIVPVYNAQDYLYECVNSLINQSYPYVQIILVDDGSDDFSGHLCDQLANDHHNIIAEHIANGGVSHARNVGLNLASGNYLMFVDSDDLLYRDAVTNSLKLLIESKSDIVSFGIKKFSKLPALDCAVKEQINKAYSTKDILYNLLINNSVGGYAWNKMFRRDAIGDLRFDESLACCEDFEFSTRVATRCCSMVMTESAFYFYRQTDTSITNDFKFSGRLSTIIDAYEKIIPIYEEFCPELVAKLLCNYLKQNLNLLGRLRLSKIKDSSKENIFLRNIAKTYPYVMRSDDISFADKLNIRLTRTFPFAILQLKQQILKLTKFMRQ